MQARRGSRSQASGRFLRSAKSVCSAAEVEAPEDEEGFEKPRHRAERGRHRREATHAPGRWAGAPPALLAEGAEVRLVSDALARAQPCDVLLYSVSYNEKSVSLTPSSASMASVFCQTSRCPQ